MISTHIGTESKKQISNEYKNIGILESMVNLEYILMNWRVSVANNVFVWLILWPKIDGQLLGWRNNTFFTLILITQ